MVLRIAPPPLSRDRRIQMKKLINQSVTKSVGPWPVFMDAKVRTTATVVDKINN